LTGVELLAGDRGLLGGLGHLRAGEQAAGRDAVFDKRLIVAAAVERRVVVGLTDPGVENRSYRSSIAFEPGRTGTGASNVDSSASYTMKM
jgi:hypothetical protein